MLDKLSKKILKYLQKNPSVGETNFNQGIFAIAEAISEKPELVRLAISSLKKSEYIVYRSNGRGRIVGFKLSHEGAHLTEFTVRRFLENWLDRIIAFIVGVLSTVLAQLIIQWFSR